MRRTWSPVLRAGSSRTRELAMPFSAVLEVGGPAPLESELLPSSARDGGAEQARAPRRDAQHGEISRLVVRSFQGADCCTCGQPPRRIGGNSSTPNVPMRPVSE